MNRYIDHINTALLYELAFTAIQFSMKLSNGVHG